MIKLIFICAVIIIGVSSQRNIVHDTRFIDQCNQEPDSGPCRALIPRYYYDIKQRRCKTFFYGGCQGNENNFFEEDDCEAMCGETSTIESHSMENRIIVSSFIYLITVLNIIHNFL